MPGYELIGKEEQEAVQKVFEEGGVLFAHGFEGLRKSYHVREFEDNCSNFFNAKHCIAVSSGTAGLKCALKAIGVSYGDEVITQSFNFIATIESIIDCGAKPIMCGVDENLHLDLQDLERKVSKKTKAIIIVHMLGMGGPIEQINLIKEKYNLPIIEDNCESIGGKCKNKFLGAIGDLGVMSFDHGKMIACGEGGMVLTNNKNYGDYVRQYSDHGHQNNPNLPRGSDNRVMPGFNYRMTELQAAVGKVQLSKLNFMLEENKKRYLVLEKSLSKYFSIRKEINLHKGSYDTFIFSRDDLQTRKNILKVLKELKFGTKNLPDSMEWHCSYFWEHALSKQNIADSKETHNLLQKQIAIPILINRNINDYENLALNIIKHII